MPLAGTGARSCNNGNRPDKYLALPPENTYFELDHWLLSLLSFHGKNVQRTEKRKRVFPRNKETIMPSPYVPRPMKRQWKGEERFESFARRGKKRMEKTTFDDDVGIIERTK